MLTKTQRSFLVHASPDNLRAKADSSSLSAEFRAACAAEFDRRTAPRPSLEDSDFRDYAEEAYNENPENFV